VVNKSELRQRLRALRRGLEPAKRLAESLATAQACVGLSRGVPASYAAQSDELDLGSLHQERWRSLRAVFLPRVAGPGRLLWYTVIDGDQLLPGAFGIPEPDPSQAALVELPPRSIVFVPGLAFTADGRRLGQGGGYYDRLLAQRPDLRAIGVGFACQLLDDLPCEAHDVHLSGLVIAGQVLVCRSA
jgi:5-formyltetrahydrofolate cyclo-ligase